MIQKQIFTKMLGQDRLLTLEVTWMIQDSGSLDFEADSQLLKAFAQFPKIRFVILKKKDIIHGPVAPKKMK